MLYLVFKKMLRNKWLVICLLVGAIIAVAMVSGIPTYSDAVFQRMLIKDMGNYQTQKNIYPGSFSVKVEIYTYFKRDVRFDSLRYFKDNVPKLAAAYKVPSVAQYERIASSYVLLTPTRAYSNSKTERQLKFESFTNIQDHIKVTEGTMFSPDGTKEQGVVEVLVNKTALSKRDLLVGETYTFEDKTNPNFAQIKDKMPLVKIVGVFEQSNPSDPYWNYTDLNSVSFDTSLLISSADYNKYFGTADAIMIGSAEWYYAFDYTQIKTRNLAAMTDEFTKQSDWFTTNYKNSVRFTFPVAADLFKTYSSRQNSLSITLLILEIPILLMLAFYIFMVAQLKVEHEKNDIAVMKSRGASRTQIFNSYVLESLILSGISLILGPPIGLLICKMLGATNGFLEFVNRKAMPLALTWKSYAFAAGALLLFMITILIPALQTSKVNIVEYKQKKTRVAKTNVWKKYFLDILLLLVSGYGFYQYGITKKAISIMALNSAEQAMDPMLFLISTFFIIGLGLLFLRIYPYLIKFVFWIGRKIWSPVFYASFIQVGRSRGMEQFIMLFMILTLSIGIFNANTARTLNTNVEDKVRFMNGADLVVQGTFKADAVAAAETDPSTSTGLITTGGTITPDKAAKYYEPPLEPFAQLQSLGMKAYTKVFKMTTYSETRVSNTGYDKTVNVMGIVPNEFADIAYMRDGLYPYSWYYLLNNLSANPDGCLISRYYEEKGVKIGDNVSVRFPNEKIGIQFVVVGFIDYWPSYNLNMTTTAADGKTVVPTKLVVANIDYIMEEGMLRPYEIWYKRDPAADFNAAVSYFKEKDVTLTKWSDLNALMIDKKNDPYLNGTNGSLTLGFIITILISMVGFIIYWLLSIKGRILQFGIFRAMGLNMKKLYAMIISEQVMISGVAVGMGILVGSIASKIFVPLIQMGISSGEEPLPFIVVSSAADYWRVFGFSSFILIAGLIVIGTIVSKININQALKLGED